MAQYRQSFSTSPDQVSLGIRIPSHTNNNNKQGFRNRRSNRSSSSSSVDKYFCKISIGAIAVILSCGLLVTIFTYYHISIDDNKEPDISNDQDDGLKNDLDFIANVTQTKSYRVLKFGHGSIAHGRDSRYWDRDDRRRDDDYNESESEISNSRDEVINIEHNKDKSGSKHPIVDNSSGKSNGKLGLDHRSAGLYNEAGRDELKHYEAEYEASLKNVGQLRQMNSNEHNGISNGVDLESQIEGADVDDEYDDGIDSLDARVLESDVTKHDNEAEAHVDKGQGDDGGESSDETKHAVTDDSDEASRAWTSDSQSSDKVKLDSRHASSFIGRPTKRSSLEKRSNTRRRPRRKYSGSSCQMKFLNSSALLVEPIESRKFSRFSLQYTDVEEKPSGDTQWVPRFAGHQTLQEREESFVARDQKINCGFVKGPKGFPSTGFDLAEDDAKFMSSCHIAVSSCIFGNSDNLRTPYGRTVTRLSRKNVCFVMFVDEKTLQTLSLEGQKPDRMGFIGLWKIVLVKNLPYADMRRVGKIPKFLTHRLFPSARYDI
ncbi:Transmembrane protein [Thalictrum thalictroides]|uniref:Transmembrane protein n=1 Tax=Thalictrum thalictroides TaxID=46969 RepID=A0A7J6W4Z9_THATH|nr:Transmembrane protein [Thalictrum thalictroides]